MTKIMQIALSSHNMLKLHYYQCVEGQIYHVCYGRAAATTHMMMYDNNAANTCSIIPHNTVHHVIPANLVQVAVWQVV